MTRAPGHGARWEGADLLLTVRVVPRAAADAVLPEADALKVRITAPPVDGRANARLAELLGRLFDVPKSRVHVEQGTTGRTKRVRVRAPRRLPPFLGGPGAARGDLGTGRPSGTDPDAPVR